MLVHLNRDLGITIVLTSHEVHSVTKLASRIAFLSTTLLFDGDPVAFERHPAHIDLEDFPEAVMPKP
jgi:ABC-type methionine transport system ATPase subunit